MQESREALKRSNPKIKPFLFKGRSTENSLQSIRKWQKSIFCVHSPKTVYGPAKSELVAITKVKLLI